VHLISQCDACARIVSKGHNVMEESATHTTFAVGLCICGSFVDCWCVGCYAIILQISDDANYSVHVWCYECLIDILDLWWVCELV